MEGSHFIPPASALPAFGPPTFIWMALDHWAALDHGVALDHQAGSENRADIESQVYFNHTACVYDSMILHTQPETFLVPQPPKTLHPSLYSVILLKVPVFFCIAAPDGCLQCLVFHFRKAISALPNSPEWQH